MRRFASRYAGLAFSLILISIVVSGCFQTAGASLEATPVGNQSPLPPPTQTIVQPTPPPDAQPTQPVAETPTVVEPTAVAAQPTETQAPPPTPEEPTQPPPTPDQAQVPPPTDVPTEVQPTEELPPPTLPPQPTPIPLPTATLIVEVAQAPTATQPVPFAGGPQGTQTAVQGTLFAQATQIIAGVTQTAAADLTGTATAQGTPAGQPPANATPGSVPPTLAPGVTPLPVTGTPQGTPGAAGSGAAGTIGADCTYTVVEGDRLLRIALRFNTTPQALARANGIVNMDLLVPGQRLRIPNCFGTPTPGVTATLGAGATPTFGTGGPATPIPAGGGNRIHVVVDGDTLYGIASRYGSRVMAIAQANGIANVNLIYIGQRLVIP